MQDAQIFFGTVPRCELQNDDRLVEFRCCFFSLLLLSQERTPQQTRVAVATFGLVLSDRLPLQVRSCPSFIWLSGDAILS